MHHYFYFPDRVNYGSPADAGLAFEPVTFASADGTRLSGWFIPATGTALGTVVHLHGNAQNMTAHWEYAAWLPQHGFNVFACDYRGYGQSHGKPDPQGIFEDAVAALDYVRGRHDTGPLCVFGQSLGGMLAIAAVGASPVGVSAVAAEAPVYSYQEWADDLMPEKELALDDTHTARTHVRQVAPVPLLILHGEADRVVPYAHGRRLFDEAGEPRRFVTVSGQHNEAMLVDGGRNRELLAAFFLEQLP